MRTAILILSLVFLVSCDNFGNLTDQEYVVRAQEFLDKGELNAASIELKNALTQNANNYQARWLLGNTYLELGNGPAAEKELQRARELGLPDETIIIPLGKALLMQGKYSDIISETQPLASMSPENRAKVHSLRGNAFLGEYKLDDAASEFQSAIALNGDPVEAQIGYARLDYMRGKREEARNWIDKALANTPESADAWSLLGVLELTEGNPTEAEAAFTNAIKNRKYMSGDIAKRAMARLQLEKYTDAEADIQTMEQGGFKDHPYVNYAKGLIFFNQKKYPDALEAFEASQAHAPSFLPLMFYLATTNYMLGNLEQAKTYATKMKYQSPQSLKAIRLLGAIETGSSEYVAATKILLEALNQSPNDAVVLDMLGKVSLLDGNTAKGVEYYQKLVSLKPESQKAKNSLNMAKLLNGQALNADTVDDQVQSTAESDIYTRDFLSAVSAFKNGKIDEALARSQELHELHPDRVDPIKLIASCYLVAGQWDRAKIELEKVLELQPNERSATSNLAKVEAQQGNLERARTLLRPLVEAYPGEEKSILLLAEIESRLGSPADGIGVLELAVERNLNALSVREKLAKEYFSKSHFEKVLQVTRDLTVQQIQTQPALMELRGKAQMLSGDTASARLSFQRLSEVTPDSAKAHFLYGNSLAKSGELDRAWVELKRAIQLDPGYLPARTGEIKMLARQGERHMASEALARLRQDFGDRPEVLGIEAWFALRGGDYATAEKKFYMVLKQKPDRELTILLVRALWAQQKFDEGIGVMQDWLETHPQDLTALLHLAGGYLSLNREEDARLIYAKVVELYPNHFPTLNNLAWLSQDSNLEQAIEYAERAYKLSPNSPNILDTLGVLLLKSGNVSRGSSMIRKAAELAPGDLEIQLHLGRALVQQELFAEAKDVLNTVVKKQPDSQAANQARVLLESIPQQ